MNPINFVQFKGLLLVLLLLISDNIVTTEGKYQPSEDDQTVLRRKSRAAVPTKALLWPDGVVPYIIDTNFFSISEMDDLRAAIETWNTETCIQLRPYEYGDNSWLRITNGGTCYSQFHGFSGRNGEQIVTLSENGCRFYGLYLHELGHVLGLAHEQSRADRDNFLNIYLENVPENLWDAFEKWDQAKINTYDTPYDLQSVMQYGSKAFSIDANKPTISVRDPALQHVLKPVYSKDLSFWDARAINQHYKCAKRCKKPPHCAAPGFIDKNCQCQVPAVFSERRCTDRLSTVECKTKADLFHCDSKVSYMSVNCRKTCGFCFKDSFAKIEKTKKPTCGDSDVRCPIWQKDGECTKNFKHMLRVCPKSCDYCADPTRPGACRDAYVAPADCLDWTMRGECDANRIWMTQHCAASCGRCPQTNTKDCEDSDDRCSLWQKKGHCTTKVEEMERLCAKSCDFCANPTEGVRVNRKVCRDSYIYPTICKYWAEERQCQANAEWMAQYCAASCNLCSQKSTSTITNKNTGKTEGTVENSEACRNTYEHCAEFAQRGDCENERDWMAEYCRESCGLCSKNSAKTTT